MLTSRDVIIALCRHCTKTCREHSIDIDIEKCLMLRSDHPYNWSLVVVLGADGIVPLHTVDDHNILHRSVLMSFYQDFSHNIIFDHGLICPKICLCYPQNAEVTDVAYDIVLDALLMNGAKFTYVDIEARKAFICKEKELSAKLYADNSRTYNAFKNGNGMTLHEYKDAIFHLQDAYYSAMSHVPKYENEIIFCPKGMANAEELMIWCDIS